MAGIAGTPLASLDAALAQEFEKGRAFENFQFIYVVDNLIAAFSEQIEILREERAIEEDET